MSKEWLKSVIDKHSLLIYFVLTFLISWGAVFVIAGPGGLPVKPDQAMMLGIALLLGPSIAGIVLTALTSGMEGLHKLATRLLKWRVKMRWYLFALLLAPFTTLATLLLLSLFSTTYTPKFLLVDEVAPLILMGMVAGIVVGTLEELGWTGFAVNRVRQYRGVVATGVIIGLLWGAWHFIVFWEANSFSDALLFAILLARLFAWLPAYRVLMVWLYERTESVFVVIMMHASLVASLMVAEPLLEGEKLLMLILVKGIVLSLITTIILVRDQHLIAR